MKILTVLVLLAVSACGIKGDPVPPEPADEQNESSDGLLGRYF